MFYYNGDLKESHKSGLVKYLYSDTTTWHTRHPDGREVTQFSNGQTEVEMHTIYTVIYMTRSQERHVDGSVSIIFPDGTTKVISPSGVETINLAKPNLLAAWLSSVLEVMALCPCSLSWA